MNHLEHLKNPTLAELNEEEGEWREAAYRMVENIHDELEELPTPDELDKLDADEAMDVVANIAENNAQLFINAECDVRDWEKIAIARIEARAKAKVPA